MRWIFLFFAGVLCTSFTGKNKAITVTLHISNLKPAASSIRIAVYRSSDNFPDENGYYKAFISTYTGSGSVHYTINGLEEGEYAFALYQDVNSNGKLNTNMFGYPVEPFCFSNNIKPFLRAPGFSQCKVMLSSSPATISVKMIR